jgi:hypothetical protein
MFYSINANCLWARQKTSFVKGSEIEITSRAIAGNEFAWCGNNAVVFLVSDYYGDKSELVWKNIHSGKINIIDSNDNKSIKNIKCTPDGNKVFYSENNTNSVYIYNVHNNVKNVFLTDTEGAIPSPDGKKIVVHGSGINYKKDVVVKRKSKNTPFDIIFLPDGYRAIRWFPDSESIHICMNNDFQCRYSRTINEYKLKYDKSYFIFKIYKLPAQYNKSTASVAFPQFINYGEVAYIFRKKSNEETMPQDILRCKLLNEEMICTELGATKTVQRIFAVIPNTKEIVFEPVNSEYRGRGIKIMNIETLEVSEYTLEGWLNIVYDCFSPNGEWFAFERNGSLFAIQIKTGWEE